MFSNSQLDWIIADHFALDQEWERAVRRISSNILVIDGQGDRKHDCEILLDQNPGEDEVTRHSHLVAPTTRRLIGPRFALLRPEFRHLRNSVAPRDVVRRIFVFFGGVDATRETAKTLEALRAVTGNFPNLKIDGVVGKTNPEWVNLNTTFGADVGVRLVQATDDIATIMARADLAIGAGGITALERMSLKLPAIVIVTAKNQQTQVEALSKTGSVLSLGEAAHVQQSHIAHAVNAVVSEGCARHFGNEWVNVVDARGCIRVADLLAASPAHTSDPE
jgi:UDP-2,4-diacetamido-2,4,6-trideoxy-beta-L-altropyranose hydrolase